ncbi:MAG: oligosaccharide flippase family protein, partial [Gammaproteobacteria bacterium]
MNTRSRTDLIFSTSLWALLQILFIQAGAFVTTMVVTRMLSLSEYGLIPLVNSLVLLLAVVLGLGLPASLARSLAAQPTVNHQRQLLRKTGLKAAPLVGVVALAVFIAYPSIAALVDEPR